MLTNERFTTADRVNAADPVFSSSLLLSLFGFEAQGLANCCPWCPVGGRTEASSSLRTHHAGWVEDG